MLDEESKAKVGEFAKELKAFMEEHDLLFWEGGIVRVAPVGAAPTFCTVEIQGIWDENVRWGGVPGGLNAGDEVLVWENPVTHRREIIAGSGATAWGLPVHDHSDDTEGGDELDPATFTPQTFIVGPNPAPYDTLGEAVTAVNAFGPGAATPAVIKIMGIETIEAGNVTIPQYCHVEGTGRGSVVNMGAGVLSLSNDSSLKDITVETTMDDTTKYCVDCNGVTGFELFNVLVRYTPYESGANVAFYFHEASRGAAYHCVADPQAGSATGTVTGFAVEDTANMLLWDCEADDTDLDDALWIGDAADTPAATTKYCSFHASGNDVNLVATDGTWTYHQDDFDPDNCTVSGVADPADGQEVVYFACTRTAGAAADFATVQAAIDWFKNRLLCAACKIDIVTGATYAETLVVEDVFCAAGGRLELEGDTRGMAGATWVDDAVITCQDANAGSGTCTLANAGAVITVTGSTGNPDFDADNWGNGDTCIVRDNAGAVTTYNISATLNNTITLTVAAPAVGNTGTSITLVPDTVVAPGAAGHAVEVVESRGVLLDGLYVDATAGATGYGLYAHDGAGAACENVLAEADEFGVRAFRGASVWAEDGACTAIDCGTTGFQASEMSQVFCQYACAIGNASYGFHSQWNSYLYGANAVAAGNDSGFFGQLFGTFHGDAAYSLDNTNYGFYVTWLSGAYVPNSRTAGSNGVTDYYAAYNSYMHAANTNVGAPTYSPAVSDTEGNVSAIITWS